MTKASSITIGGRSYDAVTGLPIDEHAAAAQSATPAAPDTHKIKVPSTSLHGAPQRSTTLHRKSLKRPAPAKTRITNHAETARQVVAVKHPEIRKFAHHPSGTATQAKSMDIGPITHPHVAKAHARAAVRATPAAAHHTATATEIKQGALQTAVHNAHTPTAHHRQPRQRRKMLPIVSAAVALILLGGYFTYLNLPNLSVRVAAAQAGINAGYPNYRPDGYSLAGPVTYSDGRVSMDFKANGGTQGFVINQSKSGWDSDAVLDNYVTPRAGSGYIPYSERGLTIYTYGDNAAWVNGGILYTIEGNAPLSSEQIRRIATSLL